MPIQSVSIPRLLFDVFSGFLLPFGNFKPFYVNLSAPKNGFFKISTKCSFDIKNLSQYVEKQKNKTY